MPYVGSYMLDSSGGQNGYTRGPRSRVPSTMKRTGLV